MKSLLFGLGFAALAGLVGCGGGGGGSAALPSPPPSASAPAPAGYVRVTVLNVYGEPLPGIAVDLSRVSGYSGSGQRNGVTDAAGVVQFANVATGEWRVSALRGEPISNAASASRTFVQPGGGSDAGTDLELTLRPLGAPVLGISNAESHAQASADGSELDLILRVAFLAGTITADGVRLEHCQPDAANDAEVHEADCLVGEPGFDSSYDVVTSDQNEGYRWGEPLDVVRIEAATNTPQPFDVAILLDQSRRMAEFDDLGWRFPHVQYLLSTLTADDQILLAAFSAHDQSGGELSLLAEQPITIYPVGEPAFGPASDTLLASLATLPTLEGGAAPLFDAFTRLQQFVTDTPTLGANDSRWLIVLADGTDDTCGSRAQCLVARQSAVDGLPGSGVKVITAGVGSGLAVRDLGRLADFGYAFGLSNTGQLGVLFDRLRPVLDGTAETYEVRFRLTSPTAGAFSPGRLLLGRLHAVDCPWHCNSFSEVPIAVRIQ